MDHKHLIKDCLQGKRDAQRKLYDHFAPSMLALCFRYTKNLDDAENILQDGFVKVFRHLDRYRNEGDLGAWVRRIMVNTALSYLKTNRRYSYDLLFDDTPLHAVSSQDATVILEGKEIANLIRQLPTGYQTVFNLYAVEGYPHKEIAAMLGIKEVTSRSQYARARALLMEWMEKSSSTDKRQGHAK